MNYFQEVIDDTLRDIRCRAMTRRIREDHELKDLYDYLGKHDVKSLYDELKENTLSEDVKKQYDLFCDIVEELVR